MSALARFFLHDKKVISGSDREPSIITEALEKEGISIFTSQVSDNISSDIDMVVYTEAMPQDHEEMIAAHALGVPMVNYFEALGQVANEYYLIAIAGTHGKTTTTAMLTDILEEAGLDPTAIIGSLRSKTGSNFRAGKSKYAIVEACEYKRDFLHLEPDILVITNIELDHVDYYKDLADVQDAFHALAMKVPESGYIIADTGNENVKPVLEGVKANIVYYRPQLDLNLKLHQPGIHNRLNAAAAIATAIQVGVSIEEANQSVENFAGTWRRFEYKGTFVSNGGKVPVYDDYAHHPTAISMAIAGARELYSKHHITVVFQSHTYSRTSELFNDFATALTKADCIILLPIYAAREENVSGVTMEKLKFAISDSDSKAKVVSGPEEAIEYIKKNTPTNGVVVTMGAGDMTTKVAEGLVDKNLV